MVERLMDHMATRAVSLTITRSHYSPNILFSLDQVLDAIYFRQNAARLRVSSRIVLCFTMHIIPTPVESEH